MRDYKNVMQLAELPIDIMGFIFYEKSPRFIGNNFDVAIRNLLPERIEAAGVFVNQDLNDVVAKQKIYNLNYLQIHGFETPIYCRDLQKMTSAKIIKAFQIDELFDFSVLQQYEEYCDFFLFDAKTLGFGGGGIKFNWELLHSKALRKPFFLSGGISKNDSVSISKISIPQLYCYDINSKFEISPGLKNIESISEFISKIK